MLASVCVLTRWRLACGMVILGAWSPTTFQGLQAACGTGREIGARCSPTMADSITRHAAGGCPSHRWPRARTGPPRRRRRRLITLPSCSRSRSIRAGRLHRIDAVQRSGGLLAAPRATIASPLSRACSQPAMILQPVAGLGAIGRRGKRCTANGQGEWLSTAHLIAAMARPEIAAPSSDPETRGSSRWEARTRPARSHSSDMDPRCRWSCSTRLRGTRSRSRAR